MNDQLFLNTPGELLAAARAKSGLGLEVLSERTKIPVIMLEAVERDEYHRISDPLYVRSFLRAYAAEVGLDPDQILEIYGRMTGGTRHADAPEEVWEEQKVTIRRVGLPWNRILAWAGLAVVTVAVVVVLVRTLGGGDDTPPEPLAVSQLETARDTTASTGETATDEPAEEMPDDPDTEQAEQVHVVQEPVRQEEVEPDAGDRRAAVDRDSLSTGWLAEAPREDPPPARQVEPEAEPVVEEPADPPASAVARPEEQREETTPAQSPVETTAETTTPVRTPEPAPGSGMDRLPVAAVGGAGLALAAGQPRSQVLRIMTTVPVTASVRRDGERDYTRYRLPGRGGDLPPLPATDIVVGTAYAVQGGVVAYWGARDHFDLVLDRVDGVEVSLNGAVRNLSRVRPGDEMVLDAFRPPSGQ